MSNGSVCLLYLKATNHWIRSCGGWWVHRFFLWLFILAVWKCQKLIHFRKGNWKQEQRNLECWLIPIVMSNSWFTCVLIPPRKPVSRLYLWFSEINSVFSLYEYKYRVHGVDWHYLRTKLKMLVPHVKTDWNNSMFVKHPTLCPSLINESWRSERIS